jgi:hypothetical protein
MALRQENGTARIAAIEISVNTPCLREPLTVRHTMNDPTAEPAATRRHGPGFWIAIGCGGIVALLFLFPVVIFAMLFAYAAIVGDGNVHGPVEPGSSLTVDDPEEYRITILEIDSRSSGPPGYLSGDGITAYGVRLRAENTSGGLVNLDYPRLRVESGTSIQRIDSDDASVAMFDDTRRTGPSTIEGWVYFELPDRDIVESLIFFGTASEPDIYFDAE